MISIVASNGILGRFYRVSLREMIRLVPNSSIFKFRGPWGISNENLEEMEGSVDELTRRS
jgi:hypothetical protein